MGTLKIGLIAAIFATMCAEGMRIVPADLGAVWRRPSKLLRGLAAVVVLVPIMALLTIALVQPSRGVAVALAFLASAPLAPFVLTKLARTGEDFRLAASLHMTLAAFSIVTAPVALMVMGHIVGLPATVAPPLSIAQRVFVSLFLPFGIGIGIRGAFPRHAVRLQRWFQLAGGTLLLVMVAVLVVAGRSIFLRFGLRDYVAMALFCVLALASGHFMAAHDDERTTYALESAARNPGVALFMATSSLGPVRGAVLLPYLLVFVIVSSLYTAVRKRAIAHPAGPRPSTA
ncbi:MAG: bile acid:sodium symporter family protein [Polyangiales bacterium]